MTDSGVQVYGASTSDIDPRTKTAKEKADAALVAWGLQPSDPALNGMAEVRLQKDANGRIARTGLLLENVELMWDSRTQRPPVIEIFTNTEGYPTQGRVSLVSNDSNRSIMLGPLPPSSDLSHYDWADKGAAGTQANYANNVYFPRSEEIRCDDGPCQKDYAYYAERQKPRFDQSPGQWSGIGNAGVNPRVVADEYSIMRLHEDGDLRAGDAKPGPNGERRFITDSGTNTGFGVSYPGFKGYRTLDNYSYQYANLSAWLTQDTVNIVEWAGGDNEHNKIRRGFAAFGDVTPASAIPASGTAVYEGAIYGYYAPTRYARPTAAYLANPEGTAFSTEEDVKTFRGLATIEVDFSAGTARITFAETNTFDDAAAPVPAAFTATARFGNPRNYFTTDLGSLSRPGGLSARFFGPVSGSGPAEIGGALSFTLTPAGAGPNDRQTVIGGFLARRK